jgi:hypothetical protein
MLRKDALKEALEIASKGALKGRGFRPRRQASENDPRFSA